MLQGGQLQQPWYSLCEGLRALRERLEEGSLSRNGEHHRGHLRELRGRPLFRRSQFHAVPALMAATNKCLAQGNKSRTRAETTKERRRQRGAIPCVSEYGIDARHSSPRRGNLFD